MAHPFRPDTRLLTSDALELTLRPHYSRRPFLIGFIGLVLILVGIFFYPKLSAFVNMADKIILLEKEKQTLEEAVEHERLSLKMEQVTREELEKQVAVLNEEVGHLKTELGFFKSQQTRQR